MPSDSLIRLRQLNKPEVSGYTVEIIKQYLNTGTGVSVASTGFLTGEFYPRKTNPSGYVTGVRSEFVLTGQTGDFVSDAELAVNNANLLNQVSSTYYPRVNPSGYINRTSGDSIYVQFAPAVNTGRVTIDDNVSVGYAFDINPNKSYSLRGTGNSEIQLYNTGNNSGAVISNFSILSDNIKLSGKTVLNDSTRFINVNDDTPNVRLFLTDEIKAINPIAYDENNTFIIRGVEDAVIDLYDSGRSYNQPYISGFDIYATSLYINGVLFTGGSSGTGISYAQLTGASGALRVDIENIRLQSGSLVPTGATGALLVPKSDTGRFHYHKMRNEARFDGPVYVTDFSKGITLVSLTPTGASGYFIKNSTGNVFVDWSGTIHGSPTITGFKIDATGLTITGNPVINRASGDILYYSVSNPSDFATKAYIAENYALEAEAALIKHSTHNTEFYLYDGSIASLSTFAYNPASRNFRMFGPTGISMIDVYGLPANQVSGKPYISGFYLTGIPRLNADEIFISGVPLGKFFSGANTGDLISMIDRKHNTGFGLWNTGANAFAFEYGKTNDPFYLQGYLRHPNGAVDTLGKIDLQNSYVTNFNFSTVLSFSQKQGVFNLVDDGAGQSLFYYDGTNLDFYLSNSSKNAVIDVIGDYLNYGGGTNPAVSGFAIDSNSIKLSGQTVATTGYVTGVSGHLGDRIEATGDILYDLIQKSNAGVSTLNGISGTVTLTGAGGVSVSVGGQTITISGDTSTYLTTGSTGNFVAVRDNRHLNFGGKVTQTGFNQLSVIEQRVSGVSAGGIAYPNIAYTGFAGFSTGAWILNTPVRRDSDEMTIVRIHGYGFGDSTLLNPAVIDFTVTVYTNSVALGNIDGLSGAVIRTSISDSTTTRNYSKWAGINASGNLAIGFGDENTVNYFHRVFADAYITRLASTGVYHTGWNFSIETGTNFNWLDKVELTGLQYHNHRIVDVLGTGAFYPRTGNPSGFLTPNDTGILDNTFVSHSESGAFYPRSTNPSGYVGSGSLSGYVSTGQTGVFDNTFVSHAESGILTGTFVKHSQTGSYYNTFVEIANTGVFVGKNETGIFDNTFVAHTETGFLTGIFYPLTGNPSGFVQSTQTGAYTNTFVSKTETGAYDNTFVSHNETGIYVNTFPTHTQTGNILVGKNETGAYTGSFYPRTGNPSGYLTNTSLVGYVQSSETGAYDNTFVSHSETGFFTGVFYPLKTNPSGYLTSTNLNGYVQSSETGAYDNTFVAHTETGVFKNTFVSYTETGQFYPRTGNPSGFITTGQTGVFYSITNPSGYITSNSLNGYVQSSETGAYDNTFVAHTETGFIGSEYVKIIEQRRVIIPALSAANSEADAIYPILGGFITNALTHWKERGGFYSITTGGGITSILNSGNILYPHSGADTPHLEPFIINQSGTGVIVLTMTGVALEVPSHAFWAPFIIGRSNYTNLTGGMVEFLNTTGGWETVYNGGLTFSGNTIWAGPYAVFSNYPIKGARFTLSTSSLSGRIDLQEVGIWNKNYIQGGNLYAFKYDNNVFGHITGSSLTISGSTVIVNSQTGSFYPRVGNPSGFVTSGQTGAYSNTFVSRTETGAYDNTFVAHTETGYLTGVFYPRFENPSEYTTTGYVTGVSGYLQTEIDATGSYLYGLIQSSNAGVSSINGQSGTLTLTGAGNISVITAGQTITVSGSGLVTSSQTGAFDNTFISHAESGAFYPRVGNPSGYLISSDLSNYVTNSQTGILVGDNETGVFRLLSETRTGTNTGPTLFNGKTRMFMDSEAYFYPKAAYFKIDGSTTTGAWVINTPIPRDSLAMFKLDVYGHEFGTSSVIDVSVIGYALSTVTGHDGVQGRFFSHGIRDNSNRNHARWVGINQSGNIAFAIGNIGEARNFQRLWVDASVHRLHTNHSGKYLTGWSITVNSGSGIASGGATMYFDFKDMESGTNGIEYHNHDAGSLTAGTVPTARVVGAYNNITSVGTLTSLTVNGTVSLSGQISFSGQSPITRNHTGEFYPRTGNPSGFVTTSQTGAYSGTFYPLNSNPSAYITAGSLIGYVTSTETGNILVGREMTGAYTNTFYPLNSNPSNYLTSADLSSYATKTDTGNLLVGKDITGNYFYPRFQNPSSYLTSADLSNYATKTDTGNLLVGKDITGTFFYPRNQNPAGYLTSSSLAGYVQSSETGAYTNTFPTHTQTGDLLVGKNVTGTFFYPRFQNPASYLTSADLGSYVTNTQTGDTLVGKNQTGAYTNTFYPLNSNPSGYLTSAGASNLSYANDIGGATLPPDTETDILSVSLTSGRWLVNSHIQGRGSSEPVNIAYRITDNTTDFATASIFSDSDKTTVCPMTCFIDTTTTKTIYTKGLIVGSTNNGTVSSNSQITAIRIGSV